jgi:hypothetical protein
LLTKINCFAADGNKIAGGVTLDTGNVTASYRSSNITAFADQNAKTINHNMPANRGSPTASSKKGDVGEGDIVPMIMPQTPKQQPVVVEVSMSVY